MFFPKIEITFFHIFVFHVPMDIRKRILPNLGQIKPESELI